MFSDVVALGINVATFGIMILTDVMLTKYYFKYLRAKSIKA